MLSDGLVSYLFNLWINNLQFGPLTSLIFKLFPLTHVFEGILIPDLCITSLKVVKKKTKKKRAFFFSVFFKNSETPVQSESANQKEMSTLKFVLLTSAVR